MSFQPLQLVSEYGVEVKTIDDAEDPRIAWVQAKEEKSFLITLNQASIKKHYDDSWVKDYVTLQYYTLGFLMHEICHIRYHTFEGKKPFDDGLYNLIDNILDDSRIEYSFWYEYPAHAKPLRWTLASVKPTLDEIKTSNEETKEKIQALLATLFRVSRFGVFDESDDEEFVSFFLPLVLSATVNDRQNLLDACGLIYLWVLEACDGDAELQKSLRSATVQPGDIGKDEIEQAADGEQIADSGVRELVEQVVHPEQIDAQKSIGHDPDHQIAIEDKTNAFCRKTIAKRAGEISDMHTTFRLTREGWDEARTIDDSGTVDNLVDAYVNSFSLDEGLNFTEPRRVVPALTMWVVRDVSSSTSDVMQEYAETCVMLHASLVDIPKVRSAQIDFSDDAKIVKLPNEALSESKLYPYVDGGTYVTSAIEILETADFGDAQKILCILTDGGFYDRHSAQPLLDKIVEEQNIDEVFVVYLNDGEYDLSGEQEILGRPAYYCNVEHIPEVIYRTVVRLRERY